MKRVQKTTAMLLTITTLFQLTGCANNRITENKVESIQHSEEIVVMQETPEPTVEPTVEPELEQVVEPEDCFATIVSFGDTLCHKPVDDAAYNKETETYDFSPMFKYVESYFEDATICIGNCETPMAGAEKGYSGYPCFNAPEHLAIDLKELGVDIMSTANNHTLDKGFDGLVSTLCFLEEAGIEHVGSARSKEEQETILFKDLNGIKTAFLAYTYGTNGIPTPEGKEFCVNLINEDFMLKQINQAKVEGAELIVVSMHWGVEYQTTENAEQDRLAELLIQNDVKIVLGCHPHVLQPMKMLKVENDFGEEKEGLVIFSQGNFFSNQSDINTQNTAIFNIEIKKDGKTGEVVIEESTYAPIYVNRKEPGAKDRYEGGEVNESRRSDEAGEEIWSEKMYNLAIEQKERCVSIIGPEIKN